jgi:carbonic anhydrase/acetyltransferase-like protein (isoleucine patch superfamily)
VYYAIGDLRPRVHESAWVSPEAVLIGDVEIHANVIILPGAVLRGDMGPIVVGEGTSVQDNAVIHEQTTIGKNCTIAHHALVHESVLEDNVLVANGAMVFGQAHVGEGALIGAGAVLNGGEVESGALMLGIPARKVETRSNIREVIEKGTRDYGALLPRYRSEFRAIDAPDKLA